MNSPYADGSISLGVINQAGAHPQPLFYARKTRRLQDQVADGLDDGTISFGLRPFFDPLRVGLKGGPFFVAFGERFPFEQVVQILIGIADRDRPESRLADTVAFPDFERDRIEAVEQRRQASGETVIDAEFVNHEDLPVRSLFRIAI